MASGRERFDYGFKTEGSKEPSTLYGQDETQATNIEAEACLHDDSIKFIFNERIFATRPRFK